MLTTAWLLIKLSFSRLIPFIVKHWLVILFCLICWYAYSQKTAHERAVQELVTFKADIAKATAKQAQENEIKRIKAESAIKSSQLIHVRQIEEIRNAYAKTNKVTNLTIADLRNRLRTGLRDNLKDDSFGVPESSGDTSRYSESERECYAAYSTLESACKITTLDFNAIRSWADVVCQTVGCEVSR